MSYPKPPEPGTYYIKSVAASKNVMEVLDINQERVACSPQVVQPASNQQWYVQRSGRGYKIKNVKHGLYLSPHSAQPNYGTVVGTSLSHGPLDWSLIRAHDGFVIQYGDEDLSITLHLGSDKPGNVMLLWHTLPEDNARRWRFERISDDAGGELAETVEDRIAALNDQIRRMSAEIAAKDQLLEQKDMELRGALQGRYEIPPDIPNVSD